MKNLKYIFLALSLGLTNQTFAQDDLEDDLEAIETGVKKPVRKAVTDNYPKMTVKGTVYDQATGKPISGVQLKAIGYPRYTAMTGEQGDFTITVPTFATSLYVSTPQYLAQQVAITEGEDGQQIVIKMLSDKFGVMYDEETEYTAKSSFTAKQKDVSIDNQIQSNLGADVRTVMHSGAPGVGASMFIRGLNSLNANAQPLIVIDGVEQDMQRDATMLHIGQFNNMLLTVSPDDIDKVTVLKNATALYGARGANGVILIDTKRGHSQATRIDANIYAGITLKPRRFTMMNASQYRSYATEMLGTISDNTKYLGTSDALTFNFLNDDPTGYYYYMYHNNTNWQDEVYRTALTQNYSINVQGGDDMGMYNLAVGYMDSKSTAKENGMSRMNVRFNTDINILWNLTTKFDIGITRTTADVFDDGFQEDFTTSTVTSPTNLALIKSPLVSPYQYNKILGGFSSLLSDYDDLYSSLGTQYSLANPSAILANGSGDNKNYAENIFFFARLVPTLDLGKNFKLSALINYNLDRLAQRYYRPYKGVPPFEIEGTGTVTSLVSSLFAKETNFLGGLRLDWQKQMGEHFVKAYVGGKYNYFSYDDNDLTTEYNSETTDKNPTLSASSGYRNIDGTNDVWKVIQWYGNVDYNFKHRYYATLSLMAEANSRFGENSSGLKLFGTHWAIFPSIQAGWVMTNEKWFPKTPMVNYLQLHAGFDVSGNDNISNYAARSSFSSVRYNYRAIGIQLTNIGNDEIKWETTRKFNIGLVSYLFNNRVGLKADVFFNKTSDLLTLQTFNNPVAGINTYWTNGGSLKNTGVEVTLTGKPVVAKDWQIEVGASMGHYKNKVTELPDGDYTTSIYGSDNILTAVGQPIGVFYGYKTEGVFASDAEAQAAGNGTYLYMTDNTGAKTYFTAGDVHFSDLNGDGKIDGQDKTIIGNPNPDIYGNIFANITWKNLTLSANFNYSVGNDVYNYQRSILNSGSTLYNQQVAEVDRWRYEGQVASLPKAYYGDPMGNNRFSDRWIEDGSYLRLKTLNLAYRVPVPGSWSWLQGLTVWAEAQNLFTLTKYTGIDPEFSISNSSLYQGIDCGLLSQSRAFVLGVKINL